MGLPNINIEFKTQASTALTRSERGIVALIVKDTTGNGAHVLTGANQIPATLSAANTAYVARAFLGYVSPPKKVLLYVLPADAADLTAALTYFETQTFDYLAGPPEITNTEAQAVATWIKAQRADGFTPKAVLPNLAADSEAIINFTSDGIKVGSNTYTALEYCSRIAGLIAGTPLNISCTYAPLAEVSDVTRLTKDEMDTAVDAGKFILFYDGEKVKVGRGVNSLQTTTDDKGAAFKKIKIVEAVDQMTKDIRLTAQDTYIGRYPNSYDNKCLLLSAIKEYLTGLETDGILQGGESVVELDLAAQEAYLKAQGTDTANMSDQELKEANTGDKVFLSATVSILDAIEDIDLSIVI